MDNNWDFNSFRILVLLEYIEQQPIPHKFKIETPMGSLESDSGNHILDVLSIIVVILFIYLIRKT